MKNGLNVKVMSDEQLLTLRKQIAAYATISQRLIQMHQTYYSSPHQYHQTGAGLRGMYFDPLMTKISLKQRWTPTPLQLQILERIFEAETGSPSKEMIKKITVDLTKHGQVSETNVYNWFQNRRARSKRKQQSGAKAESEAVTEVHSKDKKNEPDKFVAHLPAESLRLRNLESDGSLQSYRNLDHVPDFDGMLLNSRSSDYLIGEMEALESYNVYEPPAVEHKAED